ncbi:MAG: homoserine kinase [Firmicutes bacterium]|jgi:homoserine kinase|nr:homoserine kinase [Bacillota bacterium]MCL5064200.1 homoserine kinase [Bacillota bacterium]
MNIVRVPATSANLGPGYDTLGLALDLWLTVEWRAYPTTVVDVRGEGSDLLPRDSTNFVYQILEATYHDLTGYALPTGHLIIESDIPVARGLGSSAAAVVAAIRLAYLIAHQDLSAEQCLMRAAAIEHHMDNVAAAIVGGATLVFTENARPHYRRFDPPPFPIVLAIPDYLVSTDVARRILPAMVSRQDAVFNAQRVGLWIYALSLGAWDVLTWASQDRLHQEARSSLLPGFLHALDQAKSSGAVFVALSGSGSTVLAMTPAGQQRAVGEAMQEAFLSYGVEARIVNTTASRTGALDSAPVSC